MNVVKVKVYVSPTLILLAFDWPEGSRKDFLGFAIKRSPGFRGPDGTVASESWLPNRISFEGPKRGQDFPSDTSPIQKFQWWDARIDDPDRGKTFTYTVWPVVGDAENPTLVDECFAKLDVRLPHPVENGIGSYFNRAVVSSQAFSKEFGSKIAGGDLSAALTWLANGLETVIPNFLDAGTEVEGAIYHLTDTEWVVPALEKAKGRIAMVYNRTKKDTSNDKFVRKLEQIEGREFAPRSKARIMHDKFLVRCGPDGPESVLTGSANFTTEGLTCQANVLHTFDSPELASLYQARKRLLQDDPTIGVTAQEAGWSRRITVGDAKIRVFFPPEPKGERDSLDAIVSAVKKAKRSVLFCLFSPTDAELREACFSAGDRGLMMFGLVNTISREKPAEGDGNTGQVAKVEIYHRSRDNRDVYSHDLFAKKTVPEGFWWETRTLPGRGGKFPVFIHHKFVVIDAETDRPTIMTGSANMSGNSLYYNDENILEITACPRLARMYLAEFMRLYEHYRARAIWNEHMAAKGGTFTLRPNSSWAEKSYTRGTPEYKSRVNMV